MSRIAILHFTGPPAIGGVEQIMASQVDALLTLNCIPRVIVGDGGDIAGVEVVRIPALHPEHDVSGTSAGCMRKEFPAVGDPSVQTLVTELEAALAGCEHCWVHNALTVYLNPALTVALRYLIEHRADMRWVVWCEDVSAASAYAPCVPPQDVSATPRKVRYVAISEARREDLVRHFGIDAADIQMIVPPLAAMEWLGVGMEAQHVIGQLSLYDADLIVLVPAKLLPHKGLEKVPPLAAGLRQLRRRPVCLITSADSPHESSTSARVLQSLRELIREGDLGNIVRLLPDVLPQSPSRGALRDLMMLADVVFLPSHEEGYGMPLLEAAALRVPVLCSDIRAFKEVGGTWARFYEGSDSYEAVAAALCEIADTPANVARRDALLSHARFRHQLQDLL